jgi:hypothetical protein
MSKQLVVRIRITITPFAAGENGYYGSSIDCLFLCVANPSAGTGFVVGMALIATHFIVVGIADRMSDAEVKSWAKHQSLDLKGRRILRCQDDGRVALGVTEDEG